MKDKYIDECKQIQQNCTYTAEAHFQIALWHRRLAYIFQIVPAAIAAVTSTLVAANVTSASWLWITVISSVISAVATVLDPNKQYQDHLNAANNFTVLKHDARFLHEAKSQNMSDDAFAVAAEHLHEKYNELVKMTPPTDGNFFEKARKVIGAGIHEPDKDASGKIK
jgi:SMODS and SLOG-associating 2TM effector domain family 4